MSGLYGRAASLVKCNNPNYPNPVIVILAKPKNPGNLQYAR